MISIKTDLYFILVVPFVLTYIGPSDEEVYPECDLCGGINGKAPDQTFDHIFAECPIFFEIRAQIFGAYTLDPHLFSPRAKYASF